MTNGTIDVDALAEVVANLTVGDRLKAKADGTEDGEIITYRMLHRRATAMGVSDLSFDDFVDTISVDVLRRAQIKAGELMGPLVKDAKEKP